MRIDRRRLERSIEELGKIGETPRGGLTRLALTDEDKRGRDWMVARMGEAGLRVLWRDRAPDHVSDRPGWTGRGAGDRRQGMGQPAGPPRSYPPSSPSRLARKIAPLPCQAIAPTVSFSIPARVSGPEVRGI